LLFATAYERMCVCRVDLDIAGNQVIGVMVNQDGAKLEPRLACSHKLQQ
jgi:hypothetical protein